MGSPSNSDFLKILFSKDSKYLTDADFAQPTGTPEYNPFVKTESTCCVSVLYFLLYMSLTFSLNDNCVLACLDLGLIPPSRISLNVSEPFLLSLHKGIALYMILLKI